MNFFRRLKKSISTSGGGSKNRETDSDTISSLSSAYIALKTRLELKSTGRSAICIKKVDLEPFSEMKQEIENFLDVSKADFELTYRYDCRSL